MKGCEPIEYLLDMHPSPLSIVKNAQAQLEEIDDQAERVKHALKFNNRFTDTVYSPYRNIYVSGKGIVDVPCSTESMKARYNSQMPLTIQDPTMAYVEYYNEKGELIKSISFSCIRFVLNEQGVAIPSFYSYLPVSNTQKLDVHATIAIGTN